MTWDELVTSKILIIKITINILEVIKRKIKRILLQFNLRTLYSYIIINILKMIEFCLFSLRPYKLLLFKISEIVVKEYVYRLGKKRLDITEKIYMLLYVNYILSL